MSEGWEHLLIVNSLIQSVMIVVLLATLIYVVKRKS